VTDADLYLRWLQAKDEDAFREVARRHADLVLDVAWRLSGDRARAEDAMQEALLSLAKDGTARPAEVGVRAWLARRALSVGRNARTSDVARARREHAVAAARKEAAVDPDEASFREEATKALVRLSGEEAAILSLHFLHGVEYAELATVLDVAEPTARVRVHRALEALRAGMRRPQPDGTGVRSAIAALAALRVVGLDDAMRSKAIEAAIVGARAGASAVPVATAAARVGLGVGPAGLVAAGVGIGIALAALGFVVLRRSDEGAAPPPPADVPLIASQGESARPRSIEPRSPAGQPDSAVGPSRAAPPSASAPESQPPSDDAPQPPDLPERDVTRPANAPLSAGESTLLVETLRGYLDVDSADAFKFRNRFIKEVDALRRQGVELLGDHDSLLSAIYAARPFEPYFDVANVPAAQRRGTEIRHSASGADVRWGERRLSMSFPNGYYDLERRRKLNSVAPFPLIVTLHELSPDFEDAKTGAINEWPGGEAIRRLWDRTTMKAVTDRWLIVAPEAPRGLFVEDGKLQNSRIPLAEIWKRYHVDFDRIVLDGSSDALAFAVSQPNFYGGLIVRARGPMQLERPATELLGNLSTLSIFVDGPDGAPVVAALRAAGLGGRLTVGGPERLADWLETVHRRVPRKFAWTVEDKDAQQFAHWINLEQWSDAVETPTLDVECVDTADDPNTIRVTTNGIRTITMFLSDQVIDLGREVRVVVNGEPVGEVMVASKSPQGLVVKLPAKFDRTVDNTFAGAGEELTTRKTQYYT
jgi:RNA polymerase sigma-70 factor, ECF subfamily